MGDSMTSQLPFDELTGQQLVEMGKLDPSVFEQAKAAGAFSSTDVPVDLNKAMAPQPMPQAQAPGVALPEAAPAPTEAPIEVAQAAPERAPAAKEAGHVDTAMLVQPKQAQASSQTEVPNYVKGVQSGMEKQESAAKTLGDSAIKGAQEQSRAYETLIKDAEVKRIEAQKAQADQQAMIAGEMKKAQVLSEEIQKAAHVDPNRVWKNMDTGNRIVAAISIAFGAIGAGMTGKSNGAIDVIDKAIDRDIDAQKLALTQKQTTLGNQMNIVGMMRQQFGDVRAADAAALAALYDNAKLRVQQIATKYQGTETAAKAQQLQGEIEVKKNAAIMQLQQVVQQQAALKTLTAGGGGEVSTATLAALPKEARDRFVQGQGFRGLTFTEEGAKELRTSVGTVDGASKSIDRLLDISKKSGREFMPSEAKAEAQTLAAMLKGALRTEIVGPGAVSESEWKLLNDIVADPTKVMQLNDNTKKRLEVLKNTLTEGLKSKAKAQGLSIANVGFEKR